MFADANRYSRTANVGDATALGPAAGAAVRGVYDSVNPESAGLLSRLTQSANTGLDAGGKLLPEDINRITAATRADWSSRGLGASDPAMLAEAVNGATAGENVRNQRQSFASSIYDRNSAVNTFLTPQALNLTQGESQTPLFAQGLATSGASIVNPAAAYDMFNTAYNARSAANISKANNNAASQSY